jgi:hypothetical protein
MNLLIYFLLVLAIAFFILDFLKPCPPPIVKTVYKTPDTNILNLQYSPGNEAWAVYGTTLFDQQNLDASGVSATNKSAVAFSIVPVPDTSPAQTTSASAATLAQATTTVPVK